MIAVSDDGSQAAGAPNQQHHCHQYGIETSHVYTGEEQISVCLLHCDRYVYR